MKLKTLLSGSAAAMVSVAGFSTAATAADAVVAEPHPVEYVRVCDMYGAGWFYMPGTETCLRLDGYVRVNYTHTSYDDDATASKGGLGYRARLHVRTRNETDYGTLQGWIRLQGTNDGTDIVEGRPDDSKAQGRTNTDATVGVDRALISLAGFRFGYSDSYTTTHHGYGFYADANDGIYGYHQATFLDYTYSASGFSATLGIQQSGASHDGRSLDYYGGVGYTGSWGGIAGSILHDNAADEEAYKISADLNVIDGLSVRGWYMWDDGGSKYVNGGGPTYSGGGAVDKQWGVGMQYKFNDMIAFRLGYTAADHDTNKELDTDYVNVGLQITPVPGLIVRPEAIFAEEGEQYSVRVYRTF